jgi:hypothetical protein
MKELACGLPAIGRLGDTGRTVRGPVHLVEAASEWTAVLDRR